MMQVASIAGCKTCRERVRGLSGGLIGSRFGRTLLWGLGLFALLAAAQAEPLPGAVKSAPVAVTAQPLAAATRWTRSHGERELLFRLLDNTGAPVVAAAADLHLEAARGVEHTAVTAAAPGTYHTHLRWPAGLVDLALRVRLRDAAGPPARIELDLPALEPPPASPPPPQPVAAPPPPPPALPQPVPVSRPPAAPRVGFELGLAGAALVNQGVYGFGGGVDLGARFRLPFGAIAVLLRAALEQHIQPEPAPFLLNVGFTLTYRLGRPHWRISPYFGLWTQVILQRIPDALGAIALQRNESGLLLGGLAGAQLRLWHGGLFTELGYRGPVYSQAAATIPAWSTALLLLGYRFSTN